MADELFSKANEEFVSENYQRAVELYTDAINEDGNRDDFYVNRGHALIKLNKFADALNDTEKALSINPQNAKAQIRKGFALFHLTNFKSAKESFIEAQRYNQSGDDSIITWIEKCEEQLALTTQGNQSDEEKAVLSEKKKDVTETSPKKSSDASSESKEEQSKISPVPMPTGPKTRYDWYQTQTHVIISVMLKNVKQEDLTVDIQERTLSLTVKLPEGSDYSLELDLAHAVNPAKAITKVLSSKIEIKLPKCEGVQWTKLEDEDHNTAEKHLHSEENAAKKYPTSSQQSHDWDKIARDIAEDEKNEKPEGDAALNKLFQDIYKDGSDEVKKAMMKSFSESGGTVLSTNWTEVKEKKVDIKPPDGMEYKEY